MQRVRDARVRVDGDIAGRIDAGLCILVGFGVEDAESEVARLAQKIARLRVFEDESGKMTSSVLDTNSEALVVSQFTLLADIAKGNRPSFSNAAPPELAEPLYESFCVALEAEGVRVARGVFGARMEVELVNDGPVTIVLES